MKARDGWDEASRDSSVRLQAFIFHNMQDYQNADQTQTYLGGGRVVFIKGISSSESSMITWRWTERSSEEAAANMLYIWASSSDLPHPKSEMISGRKLEMLRKEAQSGKRLKCTEGSLCVHRSSPSHTQTHR